MLAGSIGPAGFGAGGGFSPSDVGCSTTTVSPALPPSSPKKLISMVPSQARMPTTAMASAVTPMASLRRRLRSRTGGRVVHTASVSSSPTGRDTGPRNSVRSAASAACSRIASSVPLVWMPPIWVSSRLRIATVDRSAGMYPDSTFGGTIEPSGVTGAVGMAAGPPGSGQRPVSSRYRIAPRPLTSSRGTASGSGPGNANRSRPSGVTRMRWGWSTPRTRPAWWARSTAEASGSRSRAALAAGRGCSAMRSVRSVPTDQPATMRPSRPSPGETPLPRLSTSSTRAVAGWLNAAACAARSSVRRAAWAFGPLVGSPTSTVSATSRRSWPSRARHRWASARRSCPNWASSRYRPSPMTAPGSRKPSPPGSPPGVNSPVNSPVSDSVRLVTTALSPPESQQPPRRPHRASPSVRAYVTRTGSTRRCGLPAADQATDSCDGRLQLGHSEHREQAERDHCRHQSLHDHVQPRLDARAGARQDQVQQHGGTHRDRDAGGPGHDRLQDHLDHPHALQPAQPDPQPHLAEHRADHERERVDQHHADHHVLRLEAGDDQVHQRDLHRGHH